MLQAETLAQAPSAAARRSPRSSGPAGRSGAIKGPTLDYRNFCSGRGMVTNYTSPSDIMAHASSGQLRCSRLRQGRSGRRDRLDERAEELLARQGDAPAGDRLRHVDKYGLNAYLYDSRNDHRTHYDRVFFSRTKDGNDSVADLEEGEWADVKVKISRRRAGRPDRRLPAQGRAARSRPQPRPPVPHERHARERHLANWPGAPGFSGSFEDYVAEKFPSSQAGDFAVIEAGIVSEDTYIEQGLYWEKLYHPLIKYVLDTYKPDLAMVGYPGTDEFPHQFLGLVTKKLPNGAQEPGLRRHRRSTAPRTAASTQREDYIRARLRRRPTRRCGSRRSTCTTTT